MAVQPVNLCAPSLFHHGDQRQCRLRHHPRRQQQILGDYAGKVLLIVNVASRCGFTKQYAGLQALNEAYAAKGLAVLGFHGDFGAGPGTLNEIKSFCSTTYSADWNCSSRCTPKRTPPSPTPRSIRWIPPAMWSGTSRNSWWVRTAP